VDTLVEAGARSRRHLRPCFGGHTGALARAKTRSQPRIATSRARRLAEASVYLGNAFVAAAAAIAGEIVDPAGVA